MKNNPSFGVLPPRGSTRIELDRPLDAGDQPMLMTATGTIATIEIYPSAIVVKNETPRVVPFMLVVIPQSTTIVSVLTGLKQLLARGK